MKKRIYLLGILLLVQLSYSQNLTELKKVKTKYYMLYIPKEWKKTKFDKTKYELALKSEKTNNIIYFDLKKCSIESKNDLDNFGFKRMQINFLNRLNKRDKEDEIKYCGKIDILNESNSENIIPYFETLEYKIK